METNNIENLITALADVAANGSDRPFKKGVPVELRINVQADGSGTIKFDGRDRQSFTGPHTAAEILNAIGKPKFENESTGTF